jgi:hypothetical protein
MDSQIRSLPWRRVKARNPRLWCTDGKVFSSWVMSPAGATISEAAWCRSRCARKKDDRKWSVIRKRKRRIKTKKIEREDQLYTIRNPNQERICVHCIYTSRVCVCLLKGNARQDNIDSRPAAAVSSFNVIPAPFRLRWISTRACHRAEYRPAREIRECTHI